MTRSLNDNPRVTIPLPVKRLFLLGLIPALLLGLYIGHATADGAKHSSAPEETRITLAAYSDRGFTHFGWRWHSVTSAAADTLAEGSAPNATTRVWENCMIRIPMRGDRNRTTIVVCPDGYTEHW